MTRTRLASPLPLFLLAAVVVALLAFGATRLIADGTAGTLPDLEITGDTAAAAPGALDGSKVFAMRVDTTVAIDATIGGEPMNGSGVVVDAEQGLIITSSHVVKTYATEAEASETASNIVVRFHTGDEVLARIEALDQFNDLAILRINAEEVDGLAAASLGDSDAVVVGSEVLSIGAPFGYEFTPTWGHVSATNRVLGSRINGRWKIPGALQHDAPVNPGNSGGPVFNARGQVVGINQQIASPTKSNAGVNFAITSNTVRAALEKFSNSGKIEYAYLGLDETATVSPQLGRVAKLGTTSGAMVQRPVDGAARAGLATTGDFSHLGRSVVLGDVIVELAGREIRSSDDLIRVSGLIPASGPVDVTFIRFGERMQATIEAQPRAVV